MNYYNVLAAVFAGFIVSLFIVLGLTIRYAPYCLILWASWQVSPWYLLCLPLWWSVLNGLSFAVKEAQNKS
jgi:hypothetical protein